MSQIQQAVLTAALTIAGGVAVFALTQLTQKFLLEPWQEYLKAVANIDFMLLLYGNVVGTPGGATNEARMEARRALRESASRLIAAANSIHCWWIARGLRIVADRDKVREVAGKLIGLSNMGDGSQEQSRP